MKACLSFLICSIAFSLSNAQTIFEPSSSITSVTVYEEGAMTTRKVDTKTITTDGIILIDSLPSAINPKTIQAQCGTGLKIISVKNTSKRESVSDKQAKDSLNVLIQIVQDSIDYQVALLKSIGKEIDVIHKNDNFGTEDGTNMEQLTRASDFYKTKLRALDLEYLKVTKTRDRFIKRRQKLNQEVLAVKTLSYQNVGVEIKVERVSDDNKTMTISYYDPRASWYTYYDLRIADSDGHLDHKAYVSQNTGEDWEDVHLTLSNRNPNKSIDPPVIEPYILQNKRHQSYRQNTRKAYEKKDHAVVHGKITDEAGEPLIGVNVLYEGTTTGTITDINGNFSLPRLNKKFLIISYIGYQTLTIDISGRPIVNVQMQEGVYLDDVVVTGLAENLTGSITGYARRSKKKEARKAISVKSQKSLNVHNFEIESLYTIPSDGEDYDVLLSATGIPFIYQYVTLPSVEATAYLKVGVPQWRSYDLFSGEVNLFMYGHYTGVSEISIEEKSDTLWFSLGEDIGLHVEKERIEEYNKKSFFKNKTIELHTFDLLVKNNKDKVIEVEILDQVPISTDDDIKVKILEISGAEHEEKQGFLTWKERLEAGEMKKVRVSYEIKYGKNVDIETY